MLKKFKLFLCLALGISGFAFASSNDKTLKVCSESGFMPFEMRKADGNWRGYEIELLQKFSEKMNFNIEFIDMKFDGLIPALNGSKTCDILASGIGVNSERKKVVLFSTNVYRSAYAALVRKKDKNRFKFYQDLNQPNISLAAESGAEAAIYTQKVFSKAKILNFDNNSDPINAILTKKADAYIDDNVFLSIAVARFPEKLDLLPLKILPHNTFGGIAFAFRKEDQQLQQQFNVFFKKLAKSGDLKKLQNYYFKDMGWMVDFPVK